MKIKLSALAIFSSCFALVSCYPIVVEKRDTEPKDVTVSDETQQTIEEKRQMLREREIAREIRIRQQQEAHNLQNQNNTTTKPVQKKTDYAFATPVPGKAGFVFSPYNNKLVDVRDIPSGTLVQDPTYPASEKKYFRVP